MIVTSDYIHSDTNEVCMSWFGSKMLKHDCIQVISLYTSNTKDSNIFCRIINDTSHPLFYLRGRKYRHNPLLYATLRHRSDTVSRTATPQGAKIFHYVIYSYLTRKYYTKLTVCLFHTLVLWVETFLVACLAFLASLAALKKHHMNDIRKRFYLKVKTWCIVQQRFEHFADPTLLPIASCLFLLSSQNKAKYMYIYTPKTCSTADLRYTWLSCTYRCVPYF